ncbi:MAG: helix-turn-helix transcriptional regulator [Microcoleus sp. SIO2G3]|nr:helix-turn-helix transcriptional regulator [Microcoleus sp. SIO2G3]
MKVRNQVEFSQFIREFRQSMELTQEQFAAFLGVTYPTINRWENGRTTPSPMALKLIEQKLSEISDRTSQLPQLYIRE